MSGVRFDKVCIREYETILVKIDGKGAERLGIKRAAMLEYTLPFEVFEQARHDRRTRLEINHELDTRDCRTRRAHILDVLRHRGRMKWIRLQPITATIENWHIRPDGCVYRDDGFHSSKVVCWEDDTFWTQNGRAYRFGAVDSRLKQVYEALTQKPFPCTNPFSSHVDILRAIELLVQETARCKDFTKAVCNIVQACKITQELVSGESGGTKSCTSQLIPNPTQRHDAKTRS